MNGATIKSIRDLEAMARATLPEAISTQLSGFICVGFSWVR